MGNKAIPKLIDDFREIVGHRIRVRRVDMKMKQCELAEAVDMPQSQLSEIERGIKSLRVDQLMLVAYILKCTASYLLGEDDQPTRKRAA